MFWINPYSQRNQRWRWIRPLEEAKAQEAAEREALQRELAERRREWFELKREIAARQQERKYEGQPRTEIGRYSFGKKPKLVSQPAAMRRGGPRPPATPAQQARLAIANARAREAVVRVRQLDPHWRPQSVTSRDNSNDFEVMIRAKEAETREAEARFVTLTRAGQDDSYPQRDAPKIGEALASGGAVIGYQMPGAGDKVRTTAPAEFENARIQLMAGARRIEADVRYYGVWYQRQDGSVFGLRLSADHGLTIDVIQSNDPLISRGLRIHQR